MELFADLSQENATEASAVMPRPPGYVVEQWIDGIVPMIIAWFAFLMVGLNTAINAYRHLLNYSRPDLQPHTLRIILVGPIYSLSAALCLSTGNKACFFLRTVRDVWEAVVIYSFLTLLVEYMGGEHLCMQSISQREEAVPHMFPLNLCLKPMETGSMIRIPKALALQFVAVKPVVAVISIVVYAVGEYHQPAFQWIVFIIYNISYSLALYALYLIYVAIHDHQALQSRRPVLKFISVKMIVFLTFWQAMILPHAPFPGELSHWEDLVLAIEMLVFGVLMNRAFSWKEFHSGLKASDRDIAPKTMQFDTSAFNTDIGSDLIDLGVSGAVALANPVVLGATSTSAAAMGAAEVAASGASQAAKGKITSALDANKVAMQNARSVFSPLDVMHDAAHTFSRRYQKHVLIESAQEYELNSTHVAGADPIDLGHVDLLDDLEAGGPNHQKRAESGGSALRTFKARTYLIGRSLVSGDKQHHCVIAPGATGANALPIGDCAPEATAAVAAATESSSSTSPPPPSGNAATLRPVEVRELPLCTREEVARHKTKEDCWVIVGDLVLDVSTFLTSHPGGSRVLVEHAGKDATEEHALLHPKGVIQRVAPQTIVGRVQGGAATRLEWTGEEAH